MKYGKVSIGRGALMTMKNEKNHRSVSRACSRCIAIPKLLFRPRVTKIVKMAKKLNSKSNSFSEIFEKKNPILQLRISYSPENGPFEISRENLGVKKFKNIIERLVTKLEQLNFGKLYLELFSELIFFYFQKNIETFLKKSDALVGRV
jgi:hypothetical protein